MQFPLNSNDINHEYRKINPKVHLETQNTVNSQGNIEQNSNAGGITIFNFKLYCRAVTIKTA
jgi:hypothetical protein